MEQDKLTLVIRNDPLILKLGEHYVSAAGHTNNSNHYISQKMREAARLLSTARSFSSHITTAKDLVKPRNFDSVVEAALKCSHFNDTTFEFSTPSLARKHGHILNRMAEIVDAEALKNGVFDNDRSSAAGFKRLMQLEWPSRVSSHALRQAANSKWNEPKKLPLTKDIMRLHKHMCEVESYMKSKIKENGITGETYMYAMLSKVSLAQLIVYNRRRPGETQFLKVQTYKNQKSRGVDAQSEVVESLSLSEKLSIERLTLVYIRGKRDRGVPLLFTPNIKASVDLLVKHRDEVGINPENPYIFARSSADASAPHRGCDCLHFFAQQCNAEHPETLTATRLRKYVATMSQLLNLKKHELEQLANHLGHDVSVHREYYRLPHEALILGKVGKLLDALEQGKIHEYKGKTLDEVVLEDSESVLQNISNHGNTPEENEVQENADNIVVAGVKKATNPNPHKALTAIKNNKSTCVKKPWNAEEIAAVHSHAGLRKCFQLRKTPTIAICKDAQQKLKVLESRSLVQIKSKVWNLIQAEKRRSEKENSAN